MPPTLLAVHAHPDDETIATGGVLARYSRAGVRTVVVTCTTGDLGEVNGVPAEGGVGMLRQHELSEALACLGVSRHVSLGYGDSGMRGEPTRHRPEAFFAADTSEAAQQLARVILEERPQVMIAYDETGGYGHPDHLKTHAVAVAAFRSAGEARPEKLYFVRFPLPWSRAFVHQLRALGIDAPGSAPAGADAGPTVPEIGVPEDLVTTAIDVRPFVALKRQALACHRSQMPPQHFLMQMPESVAEQLWATEYFSREAGPTAAAPGQLETDLFSGLA